MSRNHEFSSHEGNDAPEGDTGRGLMSPAFSSLLPGR